jgi:hypothetical protein
VHTARGSWILQLISAMSPIEKIVSCIGLKIYILYVIVCLIIGPYFLYFGVMIVKDGELTGFDIWGSLKSVPHMSIISFTYRRPLIKVRAAIGVLRIPLAGLEISFPQVRALTAILSRVATLNRSS